MRFGTAFVEGEHAPVMSLDGNDWYLMAACLKDMLNGVDENPSLADFIAFGDELVEACRVTRTKGFPSAARIESPDFRAPIPRPGKNVFCVGRNYADHIAEDNRSRDLNTDLPKYPQFFTKPATSVVGPGEPILLHEKVTRRLDYEVELAVVIGRAGRDIAQDRVEEHLFGYMICNDVTARDLQRRHDQWFKGKGLDGSCPMGPWIVHKSALGDVSNLAIRLSVNGESRQDARIKDMIFTIPELVGSLSAGLTLEAGDIIATGTPSGVGYAMDPRQYLQAGDVVRCEIEGIGVIENTVALATLQSR